MHLWVITLIHYGLKIFISSFWRINTDLTVTLYFIIVSFQVNHLKTQKNHDHTK